MAGKELFIRLFIPAYVQPLVDPKMGTVSSVPICLSSLRSLWLSVR